MSLLNALQTAGNALSVFQQEISVVQDNVINASTAGYAAQQLTVSAVPLQPGAGLSGGVRAGGIETTRSQFAEHSVRSALMLDGYATTRAATLKNVESAFDVTGNSGLSGAINNLFAAFLSWSESPDDVTQRQNVINNAGSFVTAANQTAADLGHTAAQCDQSIEQQITAINNLAREIAAVNASNQANPQAATTNDAELNAALEQLAQPVNYSTVTASDGTTTVLIDGQIPLVVGGRDYALSRASAPGGMNNAPPASAIISASAGDITAHVTSGNLGGLLAVRNGELAGLLGDATQNGTINTLVSSLATAVNGLLESGAVSVDDTVPTGVALFSVTSDATAAATLKLNPACDAAALAAIQLGPPAVANGIANQLAALGNDPATMGGGQSFIDYYGNVASQVGTAVDTATTAQTRQDQLVSQAKSLRTQISGVSLDTEAAQLTQLQQCYNASSRVFMVVQQLLDELMQAVAA
jgi:flagellar hook-associated protein 1 FlgK